MILLHIAHSWPSTPTEYLDGIRNFIPYDMKHHFHYKENEVFWG